MTPSQTPSTRARHVLAIASSGGHWQQLMAMRPAYTHHKTTYLTTLDGLAAQFEATPAHVIPDCNRNAPLRALACLGVLIWHMARLRPDVVITTGALPGVIALAVGRLFRARTIWVDSVANAEEISASGRLARRFSDLWLSQWEGPASKAGAEYAGGIL